MDKILRLNILNFFDFSLLCIIFIEQVSPPLPLHTEY